VRLYLPSTLARLAEHLADGEIPADLPPELEPFVAASEDEEDEYAALAAAAEASAALAPEDGRRVVVVADVAREDQPVPWRRVVAVHADLPGARPDDDLAWFATQEVGQLLG
jgi:hypothetical protein